MLIAERFLSSIVEDYGKNIVSTDGGTWYPQALQVPKTKTPPPSFSFGEKPDRKDNTVYQGQDRVL